MRFYRNFLTTGVEAAIVMVAIIFLLMLWAMNPIQVQQQRLMQFDQFQRWESPPVELSVVRVVDIDEASLKQYGQWPWPRTRLAELIENLHAMGATAIVFDVLLAEPDRTSPTAMADLWSNIKLNTALRLLPDNDVVFSRSLAGHNVVLGSSLSNTAATETALHAANQPYRIVSTGRSLPLEWLQEYANVVSPLPVFQDGVSGLGAMNFASDPDNVVRRVPMFLRLTQQIVPTLSAEALRVAQGARNYLIRTDELGLVDVQVGGITVPTNGQGEIWLDFMRAPATRFLSAGQVLTGDLPLDEVHGRIVLIGSSAAGLMDVKATPLGRSMPGVQAHAIALDQMLSGRHLLRPAWALNAEALALLMGTLVVGLAALKASFKWSALLAFCVLTLIGGGAWFAFDSKGLLLDTINPGLAILLIFGLASSVHHFASEREQRWIRQAFSRYVSPNRVAHLMAHPEQLQLGGKRQDCSFVFTDMADFTNMIEHSDPAALVTCVNDYLESMLEIVFRHEGTLDRIMGDALVVMFSAPVAQLDYRQRAMQCALDMHAFSAAYSDRIQAQGMAWGRTRIGVHCGEVIVGNFGGKTLFDYRAMGDPVNTAARLESVNKHLGTQVCVSQAIVDGCPGLKARMVGRLMLKGKSQWLQAYEPMAATNPERCASFAEYAEAMELLQAGEEPEQALVRFELLALRHPHDPLVLLHLKRLRQGEKNDQIILPDK